MSSILLVPQHALPAWLAGSVFLRNSVFPTSINSENSQAQRYSSTETAIDVLTISLTLLWSAFVFLGCIPFLLLKIILDRKRLRAAGVSKLVDSKASPPYFTRWLPTVTFICAFAVCFVTILFFSGKQSDGKFGLQFLLPGFFSSNLALNAYHYLLNITFFWGVPVLLMLVGFRLFPETAHLKPYFWISWAVMLIIPAFGYGINNDLGMRANMPAVFVFRLLMLHFCVLTLHRKYWRGKGLLLRTMAISFLVMGVCGLLMQADQFKRTAYRWRTIPPLTSVVSITRLYDGEKEEIRPGLSAQYLGRLNRHVFR